MRIIDGLIYDTIGSMNLKDQLKFLTYFENHKLFKELLPKIILKRTDGLCPLAKSLTVHCFYNIDAVDQEIDLNLKVADIVSTFTCDNELPVLSTSFIQLPSVRKTIAVSNSLELNFVLKSLYTMLFCKEREMNHLLRPEIVKLSLGNESAAHFTELLQFATDIIISDHRANISVMKGIATRK
jgi:hypothetical protein